MKCETVFIYCLKDPTTGDVRYIGQTKNPKKRLGSHCNTSIKERSRLGNWLKSLASRREKPILTILHEVRENASWAEEERRYISCAKALGLDLVNATDGGEGTLNPSLETRKKISAALKGVKRSPEARAKMSAGRRGMKLTPEHRARIGAAQLGRKRSPETCAKMGAWQVGRKFTAEQCAANSARQKGRKATPEARANMSAALLGVPKSPKARLAVIEGCLRAARRRRLLKLTLS